jgi:hypothetical protein
MTGVIGPRNPSATADGTDCGGTGVSKTQGAHVESGQIGVSTTQGAHVEPGQIGLSTTQGAHVESGQYHPQ